ncbi:MAG: AAA family ATPase [Candidatus Cryptobacteroides sp.]|nr:AAA family ATPase [Candidatus Cryptobacteroides sp.]
MITKRYLIRKLTGAEVGVTKTNEKYIRCQNDFDYEAFFQQKGSMNGSVIDIDFKATDHTNDSEYGHIWDLRFVYFVSSNKEKRIPSLTPLFSSHNTQDGDIVKLVSITAGGKTNYEITFFKKGSISVSGSYFTYEETILEADDIPTTVGKNDISEYISLLKEKLNLVLTGAPGTGKTYLAKQIAAETVGAIDWDDLMNNDDLRKRVKVVQFHPSYDYTDFVEGLRPNGKGDFVRINGAFKEFCRIAIEEGQFHPATGTSPANTSFADVYASIVTDIKNGVITHYGIPGKLKPLGINASGKVTYDGKTEKEDNLQKLYDYFLANDIDDALSVTRDDYFRYIEELTGGATKTIDYSRIRWMLQIMLTRAKSISTVTTPISASASANADNPLPYVFIIDEINRGELSKIFGELFSCIEKEYRGPKNRVDTQYQKLVEKEDIFEEGFYVPNNVYIIGTMNDIDRGVETMDFAIRRRFSWKEVTAEESAVKMHLLPHQIVKMTAVNNALLEAGLSKDYFIGGSYFRKLVLGEEDKLWKYYISGIIQEYFRGDADANDKIEKVKDAYEKAVGAVTPAAGTGTPATGAATPAAGAPQV